MPSMIAGLYVGAAAVIVAIAAIKTDPHERAGAVLLAAVWLTSAIHELEVLPPRGSVALVPLSLCLLFGTLYCSLVAGTSIEHRLKIKVGLGVFVALFGAYLLVALSWQFV